MKTQSYKKGLAFVLTLAMVFTTLFGGFGFLGVKGMVGEAYAAEDVEWSNGTSLGNITITDGAIINVSGTVTLTGIITISGSAIITGSGIIQAKSDFLPARMIDVPAGSTLTISGVTMDANNRYTRGIEVAGTLNMEGSSKILNCAAVGSFGGTAYAVNITGTGEFNMHDSAEIRGCKHGGVYMNGSAAFNMNDTAIITDCEVGVGVWVNNTAGSFHMADNAIISDCHSGDGGGVYSCGTVIMSEYAEISNCTASSRGGGGICIDSGTFSMQDNAKISSCSSISTAAYHGGGGIRIGQAIFNMSGGTIENCESATYGGGMYINASTLNLSGGIIQNCEAPAGGGIAIGSFDPDAINVSGSTKIVNNTISGTAISSNIQLKAECYVQIAGSGLTAGASLGITHATSPTGYGKVNVVTSTALHTVSAADAAYFQADNSAYFITYSSIVADNALLLVANGWTPPVKNGTPTAIFNASNMTLSNLTTSMQYSEDGGGSWNPVAASSISMSGVTTANGIKIKTPGNSGMNTLDSDIQTITLTKAATPTAGTFTVTDPATISATGTIAGITAAMEYSTNSGSSWTTGVNPLSGLAGGTAVLVRIKGAGTVLASDHCTLTITAYVPTVETTPAAGFEASTMTLSNISSGMKYSVNGGTSYINITSNGSISITGVTDASGIKVYKPGNGTTTTNSAIQTIPITKAATPATADFTVNQPGTVGGTGTIAGITAAMEYSTNSGTSWTAGGSTLSNIVGGTTCLVRVKGSGTVLASDNCSLTIDAYDPTAETTPTAGFEASTMTLSNIISGMKYSVNGGTSYITITSNGSITISGVTATNGIKVYKAGDGTTTTNSAIQTMTITKAATPAIAVFTVTQPNTVGGTGTIAGITASMEYSTNSGSSWTTGGSTLSGLAGGTTILVRVKASGTVLFSDNCTVTIDTYLNGGGSGGGGGHSSTTPTAAPASATVNVNGQSQDAGTTATSKIGDKTVTTVTIDDKKIQEKVNAEGNNSTVSIPISGTSDIGQGVLNGQTIKDMEKKESILEIKTNGATYTLPAAEINIDSVSSKFGQSVDLKDIKITVKIAEPSADTTKIVENTADKNNYQVVVKPVEFEITCSNGSKTVEVSKFNGYVERMVAIPVGIDASKVTTGIVLNNDGTFSHVPTTIVKIDGKYYAKINSLTNSTYSVIYNPIEFADVAKHWAKASINNMGSRLVISGVGENEFEPNRDITRAEFAAIMVRALGLTPDATKNTFSDVAASKWYGGYVGTAVSYGIISGYDADTFAPNAKITREQAMAMVARAMAITDLDQAAASSNTSSPLAGYADTAKISSYAKASIIACLNTGVVTGKTADTIAPKSNITRAEVAVIIERLLKKSKLI